MGPREGFVRLFAWIAYVLIDLASFWPISPSSNPCAQLGAKTKGKVERPVRHVRGNFFYGREFIGDADLDDQRIHWLDAVANVRVHRTIQTIPRVRFETEEVMHLQALAERPYRPLVLPEARERRRTVVHALAPAVERRGLATYQQRNHRRLDAAMRSSRLPAVKTLADFDFSFQPSVKREQLESLHTLGFLERKGNVGFLGPPGGSARTACLADAWPARSPGWATLDSRAL